MVKKIITSINIAVVTVILIPFYFLIIGLAYVIHSFTKKKVTTTKSFWRPFHITNDFTSPY